MVAHLAILDLYWLETFVAIYLHLFIKMVDVLATVQQTTIEIIISVDVN
jgi:hypothetical protein